MRLQWIVAFEEGLVEGLVAEDRRLPEAALQEAVDGEVRRPDPG